jgi:hypothetical protein
MTDVTQDWDQEFGFDPTINASSRAGRGAF